MSKISSKSPYTIGEESVSSIVGETSEIDLKDVLDIEYTDKAAAYDPPREPMPPGMDRRLLLKSDIFITTLMGLVYGMQYADKTMTSAATTMGLRQDLNMVNGSGYSWSGSAFYMGYLVFVFPMSYLLIKFPLSQTTGVVIALWGMVAMCTAACKNMASFLALRTLLGALESAVMPAYVVLTSQYYKRSQQYSRTLCWMAMDGFGTILSNSLGVGLLNRHSKYLTLHGWRVLYLIMGGMTIALGIIFFFYMPNSPDKAWFFNEEEKKWQLERIRENKQGYGGDKIKWYQVKEAILDVHTWLYSFAIMCSNVPNGAITTMMNLILQGMHYNAKQSLVMALPNGGCEVVGLLLVAVVSSYVLPNHRLVWSCSCAALSLMCLCLVAWGPNAGSQLTGIYLWAWFSPTSEVGLISCIESNSAGHTKKLTTNALFFIFYSVGNIVGPQTFKSSQAPEYPEGKEAMAICSAIQLLLECLVLVSYIVRNKKRDREDKRLPDNIVNPEFADLTDIENPEFRYAL